MHTVLFALMMAGTAPTTPPAAAPAAPTSPTSSAPAAPAQTEKIRILTMAPEGAPAELGAALSTVLAQSLADLGPFAAVAQAELTSMLDIEAQQQAAGCTDSTNCVAEVVGAVGADYYVSGRLVVADELYVLQLLLTDTKKAQVVARESRDIQGKAALFDAARGAVRVLVQGLLAGRAGSLVIVASEPGATIAIDRRTVGVSPLPAQTLGAGTHTVTAEKDGFISAAIDVTVVQDEVTTSALTLRPSPQYRAEYESNAWSLRIAAAALGAGGVLAGLVAGGLWLLASSTADDVRSRTEAYNAGAIRPREEFEGIQAARQTVGGLEVATLVSGGVAIVLLGGGASLFLAGPDPGRYVGQAE
jgi:hypothetical protein